MLLSPLVPVIPIFQVPVQNENNLLEQTEKIATLPQFLHLCIGYLLVPELILRSY